MAYYRTERAKSVKKLKSKGLKSLDAMDAYWLTTNKKSLRLFEKDLTLPEDKAVRLAIKQKKSMPKKRLAELGKLGKIFKKDYDTLLTQIAKAKDK